MAKRSGYSQQYFANRRAAMRNGTFVGSARRIARNRSRGIVPLTPTEPPTPKPKRTRAKRSLNTTMVNVDGINVQVPSNMRKSTLAKIRALPEGEQGIAVSAAMRAQARTAAHHARNAAKANQNGNDNTGGTTAAPNNGPTAPNGGTNTPPPRRGIRSRGEAVEPTTTSAQRRAAADAQGRTIQPATPVKDERAEMLDRIGNEFQNTYGAVVPNARKEAAEYATYGLDAGRDEQTTIKNVHQIFNTILVGQAVQSRLSAVLSDGAYDGSDRQKVKPQIIAYMRDNPGVSSDDFDREAKVLGTANHTGMSPDVVRADFNSLRSNFGPDTFSKLPVESLDALGNSGLFPAAQSSAIRAEVTKRSAEISGLTGHLLSNPDGPLGKTASDYMVARRKQLGLGHIDADMDSFKKTSKFLNSDPSKLINSGKLSPNPDLNFTKGENPFLKSLWRDQKFDAPMEVVDNDTFEKLSASGDFHTVYRGVGAYDDNYNKSTARAVDFQKNHQTGDYYAGAGIYGQGSYYSPDVNVAMSYASLDRLNNKGGAVVKTLIPKSANVTTMSAMFDDISNYRTKTLAALNDEETAVGVKFKDDPKKLTKALQRIGVKEQFLNKVTGDEGYWASFKGIDAYQVDNGDADHWVLLNRGIGISSKKILTSYDDR